MSYFYEITLAYADGSEVSSMVKHEQQFTTEEFSKFHNQAVEILEDTQDGSEFPNEVEEIANILVENFGFEHIGLQAAVLLSDEITEVNTFEGKVATYTEPEYPEIDQDELDKISEFFAEKEEQE